MARKQKRRPLSPSKNKSQWQALRESQVDEKRFREESIARLQKEYTKIQKRIDAMYLDKLDGRIDAAFFDAKRSEWREEQDQLLEATAGSGSLALTVNSRPKTVEKLSATSPAFFAVLREWSRAEQQQDQPPGTSTSSTNPTEQELNK